MKSNPNLDKLLEDIKHRQERLFNNRDIMISLLQNLGSLKEISEEIGGTFLLDFLKLTMFIIRYDGLFKVLPPPEALFDTLISIEKMSRALEKGNWSKLKEGIEKLKIDFAYAVCVMASWEDGAEREVQYRQALYGRIGDLPEDSIFRQVFVEAYTNDRASGKPISQTLVTLIKETIAEIHKTMKPWEVCLDEVIFGYMTRVKAEKINSSEGLSDLIKAINTAYKVFVDSEAPQEVKSSLLWGLRTHIMLVVTSAGPCFAKEFLSRKNEIEQSNALRNYVIFYCVQEEVLSGNFSNLKEFDERMVMFYHQYGERNMLAWDMNKEDAHCKETLPEHMKKYLAGEEAKRDEEHKRVQDVCRKWKEIRVSKGITDDEAFELLSQEDRSFLESRWSFNAMKEDDALIPL